MSYVRHILTLPIPIHFSGVIMKVMDRGVDAADALISYLFLFLVPALLECLAVILLFFISYKQYILSLIICLAIVVYVVVTVYLTNYRKKFREETNKHDNDYHNQVSIVIIHHTP